MEPVWATPTSWQRKELDYQPWLISFTVLIMKYKDGTEANSNILLLRKILSHHQQSVSAFQRRLRAGIGYWFMVKRPMISEGKWNRTLDLNSLGNTSLILYLYVKDFNQKYRELSKIVGEIKTEQKWYNYAWNRLTIKKLDVFGLAK